MRQVGRSTAEPSASCTRARRRQSGATPVTPVLRRQICDNRPPTDPLAAILAVALGGLGCERVAQRCPGGYAEFGEDLVQVGSDGAMRQEKLLADLFVGQAGGGQHRDLAFLRRERVACWLIGAGIGLAGCLELACGPAGPRPGAEAFEGLQGSS